MKHMIHPMKAGVLAAFVGLAATIGATATATAQDSATSDIRTAIDDYFVVFNTGDLDLIADNLCSATAAEVRANMAESGVSSIPRAQTSLEELSNIEIDGNIASAYATVYGATKDRWLSGTITLAKEGGRWLMCSGLETY